MTAALRGPQKNHCADLLLGRANGFGARPLRRTIQRYVENPLAKKVLAGEFPEGSTVQVKVAGDTLTFEMKQPVAAGSS